MDIVNAVGRRKTAIARVYLVDGKGDIKVNKRSVEDYFRTNNLLIKVCQPLSQLELNNKYDIRVNVEGGGITGQAEAIRLAIARALCAIDAEHRAVLKPMGYLTRDPRMVERKKYGRRKARRRFQFSKR